MLRESPFLVRPAALVLAVLGFAAVARGTPITYDVSGVASGTIGGAAFTNALVRVTLAGDTDDVVMLTDGSLSIWVNPGTTTVRIAGIGTAGITDSTAVYSFPTPVPIDPSLPVLPYVVIGTLDSPPALDSFTGIAGLGSNALLGYDLRTSFGPLTATPGGMSRHAGVPMNTTLGPLSFDSGEITPTTEGTFTATVPEPTSLLLLGGGIAGLAGRARSRRSPARRT